MKPKLKQYFALGTGNPLVRYGLWILFILLCIRLTYVGFKGIQVPEPGKRAPATVLAPRSVTCQKSNPDYDLLAQARAKDAHPIYFLDNAPLNSQVKEVQKTVDALRLKLDGLIDARNRIKHMLQEREKFSPIKTSPYLGLEEEKATPDKDGGKHEETQIATLKEQATQLREEAMGLIQALAGESVPLMRPEDILREFETHPTVLDDILEAAGKSFDRMQGWYVVANDDGSVAMDRSRGIIVAPQGIELSREQRIYSESEAREQVRNVVVPHVIRDFPALRGSPQLTTFLAGLVSSRVHVTFRKDLVRSQEAQEESIATIPREVLVEFAAGEAIVSKDEPVEEWQAACIAQFSRRFSEETAIPVLGIQVSGLLLLVGISLLVIFGSIGLRSFAIRTFRDKAFSDTDYLATGVLLILHLSLVRLFLFISSVFSVQYPAVKVGTMLTACPVAVSVMVVSKLMGARRAFVALLFLLVMTVVVLIQTRPELLGGNFPAYHSLYMLVVSLAGIWITKQVTRRGSFFVAGMTSGLAGMAFWVLVLLLEGGQMPPGHFAQLIVAAGASGGLSYILLISITPIFEYVWDYTTDSRLVELSSSEHPALKELSRRAPGTYQHSLWVATLVEDVAETIGANPLLAKVGCLYHDIGKLTAAAESGLPNGANESPLFFSENQTMGSNPHDNLPAVVSARILRKHVELSVKMIRKFRLGRKIEEIAAQHHGTSLMEHFYNKALLQAQEEGSQVDESDFRYPGPKPQSREAALVMLADSVEAAVRSLPRHTEEKIAQKVRMIVSKRRTDGQLDDSGLTFGDVKKIEESFIRTLVSMYHARPEYLVARPEESTVKIRRDSVDLSHEEITSETSEDQAPVEADKGEEEE